MLANAVNSSVPYLHAFLSNAFVIVIVLLLLLMIGFVMVLYRSGFFPAFLFYIFIFCSSFGLSFCFTLSRPCDYIIPHQMTIPVIIIVHIKLFKKVFRLFLRGGYSIASGSIIEKLKSDYKVHKFSTNDDKKLRKENKKMKTTCFHLHLIF